MLMLTIDNVCEQARQIPCSPQVLPEALRILDCETAGIDVLQQLIMRDTALSSAVLKMANSVFFKRGQQCDTIGDAVLRLGFLQTYRVLVTVAGGRWGTFDVDAFGWSPGDFCRHSLAVGVGAQLVARDTGVCRTELAYTADLIHDVGKLALAYAGAEAIHAVKAHQQAHGDDWLASEAACLRFTHAEISERLLTAWQFPPNLVAVGRWYAYPDQAPAEHRPLLDVVHVSKHLAIQLGIGLGMDAFWTHLDTRSVEALGLTEEGLRDYLPMVADELSRLLKSELLAGKITF